MSFLRPAATLRNGDKIVRTSPSNPLYHPEYEVTKVEPTDDGRLALYLRGTHAADRIERVEEGELVSVTERWRNPHVEVTWTILDPMTDQLIADRRTDRVNLVSARAHGHDDVTGIQRILAVKQFSSVDYAPSVVILSVKEC